MTILKKKIRMNNQKPRMITLKRLDSGILMFIHCYIYENILSY